MPAVALQYHNMSDNSAMITDPSLALQVEDLGFAYSQIAVVGKGVPVLSGVNINLPFGARCILVGANGAGS